MLFLNGAMSTIVNDSYVDLFEVRVRFAKGGIRKKIQANGQ